MSKCFPLVYVQKDALCVTLNGNHTKYFRIYFIHLLISVYQLSPFIHSDPFHLFILSIGFLDLLLYAERKNTDFIPSASFRCKRKAKIFFKKLLWGRGCKNTIKTRTNTVREAILKFTRIMRVALNLTKK